MIETNWNDEYLTKDLISRLQGSDTVDSREFLRPIFKWTKANTKNFNIEKAFEFAKYMVKLSKEGDNDLKIPIQHSIQPLYAYNTLVLMAQRISEPKYAMKAFNEMKIQQYDIDVFTLTALLDVVGRSNDTTNYGLAKSLQIFYDMLKSSNIDEDNNRKLRPNVVTFVTLMRLIGKKIETTSSISSSSSSIDEKSELDTGKVVLDLLHLAHELSSNLNHTVGAEINQIDMSIYNAALAVTVRSLDTTTATSILHIMKEKNAGYLQLLLSLLSLLLLLLYRIK